MPAEMRQQVYVGRHYYVVLIYENKSDMHQAAREISPHKKDWQGGFNAITIPKFSYRIDANGKFDIKLKLGTVLFCLSRLTYSTLIHESVHVAADFLRDFDMLSIGKFSDENEENLADITGKVADQIISHVHKNFDFNPP